MLAGRLSLLKANDLLYNDNQNIAKFLQKHFLRLTQKHSQQDKRQEKRKRSRKNKTKQKPEKEMLYSAVVLYI